MVAIYGLSLPPTGSGFTANLISRRDELGRVSAFVNPLHCPSSLRSKRNFDFNGGGGEPTARRQGDWDNEDFMEALGSKANEEESSDDKPPPKPSSSEDSR